MAITLDTATGSFTTGTNLSWSHTAGTLTNGIVFVGIQIMGSISGTPTYGGVSMVQVGTRNSGAGNIYLYVALATSGSKTVSIDATASVQIWGSAVTYNGASQTTTVDNSTTNITSGAQTSLTTTLTPVASGCWATIVCGGARVPTASTNVTSRYADTTNTNLNQGDSNGTAAGSYGQTFTFSSTNQEATVMASFAPAVTGPVNVKTFDGVTQSTGIKTYLGVALASTKSVDGIT
jgi:hypothetical protein